jgi:peptidoglycan-N-acetylglucosamine deacetylase
MTICRIQVAAACWLLAGTAARAQDGFAWPEGKRAAISFSFDDARLSQVDVGGPFFEKQGVKATFYVSLRSVEKRLDGWKKMIAFGHEIGSHSMSHACTGNYGLGSGVMLENFDLPGMAKDLDASIEAIKRLLGVTPTTFAYPCGQKFVGRGVNARSYIPVVAERFLVGRGYLDERANNPQVCDLAAAMGMGADGLTVEETMAIVATAVKQGRWLILVGHEIGPKAFQRTDTAALEAVIRFSKDPANGVWLDTVINVGRYVQKARAKSKTP